MFTASDLVPFSGFSKVNLSIMSPFGVFKFRLSPLNGEGRRCNCVGFDLFFSAAEGLFSKRFQMEGQS